MIADTIAVILVALAAIPATLGPIVYARRPWRTTSQGRAVMHLWIGMALLIDISLLYKAFGDNYFARDVVRLSVYAYLALSLWLLFLSLLKTPRE